MVPHGPSMGLASVRHCPRSVALATVLARGPASSFWLWSAGSRDLPELAPEGIL